jgi:alpha-beta hydrolase superfamily lysophospholipase
MRRRKPLMLNVMSCGSCSCSFTRSAPRTPQKSDVAGRGIILSAPAFRVSGNSLCPKPYWGFFRGVANVMSTIAPSLSSPGAKSDDLTCSAELNQATEDSDFTFGSTITAHNGNQLVLTGMEARTTAVGCKASLLLLHGLADAICPPYGSEEVCSA